jgi:aminopeptidase YwaD
MTLTSRVDPARLRRHVVHLVRDIGPRPPGSPANTRANAYVTGVLERAGLPITLRGFRTRWWQPGPTAVVLGDDRIDLPPSPYSRQAVVEGPPVRVRADAWPDAAVGAVVLVGADVVPEPLWPACFPFLQFPEHRRLVARLAALRPAAVVALVDGPPAFEDPDLPFPALSVPAALGPRLEAAGHVRLEIGGRVRDGSGHNVSAGATAGPRVVLSAHVDSKATTPGAFDNAASVAAVLAAAEAGLPPGLPVEVCLFNGEDHVDACGEQAWLDATDLSEIRANVNLDGVGVAGRATTITALSAPPELEAALARFLVWRSRWQAAPPWVESDHALFAMRGIPAVALTCEGVHDLLRDVAHTPSDDLDVVDLAVLADAAGALRPLLAAVDGAVSGNGAVVASG